MAHRLASHIRIALFDQRAVVLDIAADRYGQIGGQWVPMLEALASGRPCNDASALVALMDAGIVVFDDKPFTMVTLPCKPTAGISRAFGPHPACRG